jgi:hypothetical protein
VQSAVGDTNEDRVAREPAGAEVGKADHTVLSRCAPGDQHVASGGIFSLSLKIPPLDDHAWSVARPGERINACV